MNSNAVVIGLRLIHIVAGAAWVGSTLILVLFVFPRPGRNIEGSRLVQRLVSAGLARWMGSISGATVLAGLFLYVRDSRIGGAGWSGTPAGMALGIGGALGFVAALIGGAYVGRAAKQLANLGDAIGTEDAAPKRVLAEKQLASGGWITVVLLVLSTAAMSVARYL